MRKFINLHNWDLWEEQVWNGLRQRKEETGLSFYCGWGVGQGKNSSTSSCSLNLLLASKEEYWGFLLVCPDVGDNGKREGWGLTAFNSETSKNEVRLLIIVPWSLSFMTLKFLKSTVHLVCRILLSLDSSNISSLDSDYTFLVLYIS